MLQMHAYHYGNMESPMAIFQLLSLGIWHSEKSHTPQGGTKVQLSSFQSLCFCLSFSGFLSSNQPPNPEGIWKYCLNL